MSAREDNPPEPPRLRDAPDVPADASAAWAVGLLRGAEPYRAPAGRKQRVQLRLGHTPRRHPTLVLRLAVVSVVLFVGAGIVSAALGHWPRWISRAYERVVGPPPGEAPSSAPARARAPRRSEARPVAESPPAPSVEAPQPRVAREPIATPRARRTIAAAPPGGEDTSAVSAAMRALRVERNPARARTLLARYLNAHPSGDLAEEALALSIEAAVAQHDGDVAALASRYLRQYPRGSFQELARQALATQPARDGAQIP